MLALVMLLVSLPLIAIGLIAGYRMRSAQYVGRNGRMIRCARLSNDDGKLCPWIGYVPFFWSILLGDLDWVGPSVRETSELNLREENQRLLTRVSPGLVCSWWVRMRTNIAYGSALKADVEFVSNETPRMRIGILLRAVLAALYGEVAKEVSEPVKPKLTASERAKLQQQELLKRLRSGDL